MKEIDANLSNTPLGSKIYSEDLKYFREELQKFMELKEKYLSTKNEPDFMKLKSSFLYIHSSIKNLESLHCITHQEHEELLSFLKKGI